MKVRELMTGALVTVGPDTPVFDARRTMVEKRIRHLLVTQEGRLLGILTDRDIRLNLPSPASSLSVWEMNYLLARLTVGEAMTTAATIAASAIRPVRPTHFSRSCQLWPSVYPARPMMTHHVKAPSAL